MTCSHGVRDERNGVPCADLLEVLPECGVAEAAHELLATLPGWYAATSDRALADALAAAGAGLYRHAHQLRRSLAATEDAPAVAALEAISRKTLTLVPVGPDSAPPRPWQEVLPDFLAAYPPEHPDHLPGGEDLIESYLVPYTAGARLGALIDEASCLAVSPERVPGGLLIVDRPDEGPWVCDIWRGTDPALAGLGSAMLQWSMARLVEGGHSHLGLSVTDSNRRARRAYERLGFAHVATAWTFRLPA